MARKPPCASCASDGGPRETEHQWPAAIACTQNRQSRPGLLSTAATAGVDAPMEEQAAGGAPQQDAEALGIAREPGRHFRLFEITRSAGGRRASLLDSGASVLELVAQRASRALHPLIACAAEDQELGGRLKAATEELQRLHSRPQPHPKS